MLTPQRAIDKCIMDDVHLITTSTIHLTRLNICYLCLQMMFPLYNNRTSNSYYSRDSKRTHTNLTKGNLEWTKEKNVINRFKLLENKMISVYCIQETEYIIKYLKKLHESNCLGKWSTTHTCRNQLYIHSYSLSSTEIYRQENNTILQ